MIVLKQMHPPLAWCGFRPGGIIGRYFFENAAAQAVTVRVSKIAAYQEAKYVWNMG